MDPRKQNCPMKCEGTKVKTEVTFSWNILPQKKSKKQYFTGKKWVLEGYSARKATIVAAMATLQNHSAI